MFQNIFTHFTFAFSLRFCILQSAPITTNPHNPHSNYIPLPSVLLSHVLLPLSSTTDCVLRAVRSGFRGIDTACQPKHYREDLVGEAMATLIAQDIIKREDLFLQTKFTPIDGQDQSQPLPYDKHAPLPQQVRQSFNTSLSNLRTPYIDSLLLHSPLPSLAKTMVAWRVFETLHQEGLVRCLGISNIYDIKLLEQIWDEATVKPSIVQNRFYRNTHYDQDIRAFCARVGVQYQSFWTLTANPFVLNSPLFLTLSKRYDSTPAQLFYRFVMALGVCPLSGTTDDVHMAHDMVVGDIPLAWEDVEEIKKLMGIKG